MAIEDREPITFEEALKRVHAYQPPNKKQRAKPRPSPHPKTPPPEKKG